MSGSGFRWVGLYVALLAIAALPTMSSACTFDPKDWHYPTCTIPLSAPGQIVTVITNWRGDAVTDLQLVLSQEPTQVATVVVPDNDLRNYVVLYAWPQTIWRFTGDVESIDRVIVLGSVRDGAKGAGVTGLPPDRVTFTNPDLALLSMVRQTSCTVLEKVCTPRQWFGSDVDPRARFHPPIDEPWIGIAATFVDYVYFKHRADFPLGDTFLHYPAWSESLGEDSRAQAMLKLDRSAVVVAP